MNTSEVTRILTRTCDSNVIGVFAIDQLLSFVTKNGFLSGCYVFNTDISSRPGEHWIAIYVKQNKIIYFDSYGSSPSNQHLISLMKPYRVYINNICLQGATTISCGYYCVCFLALSSHGWSLNKIVSRLCRVVDRDKRDHAVIELFEELMPEEFDTFFTNRVHIPGTSWIFH